jgi:hypothetical protein
MSKRLTRIFQQELPQKANQLFQRDIHVVLESNQTIFGKCLRTDNQLLLVEDYRFHRHTLAFTQIVEVIYDQTV